MDVLVEFALSDFSEDLYFDVEAFLEKMITTLIKTAPSEKTADLLLNELNLFIPSTTANRSRDVMNKFLQYYCLPVLKKFLQPGEWIVFYGKKSSETCSFEYESFLERFNSPYLYRNVISYNLRFNSSKFDVFLADEFENDTEPDDDCFTLFVFEHSKVVMD